MPHKLLFAMALAASLAGCVGPGLTGNSTGGIIPYSPENEAMAPQWADMHCARFGKQAEHMVIIAKDGQYISFECQYPYGATR
jgi:hypothetical protein